jgi:hypothetical protein
LPGQNRETIQYLRFSCAISPNFAGRCPAGGMVNDECEVDRMNVTGSKPERSHRWCLIKAPTIWSNLTTLNELECIAVISAYSEGNVETAAVSMTKGLGDEAYGAAG